MNRPFAVVLLENYSLYDKASFADKAKAIKKFKSTVQKIKKDCGQLDTRKEIFDNYTRLVLDDESDKIMSIIITGLTKQEGEDLLDME